MKIQLRKVGSTELKTIDHARVDQKELYIGVQYFGITRAYSQFDTTINDLELIYSIYTHIQNKTDYKGMNEDITYLTLKYPSK